MPQFVFLFFFLPLRCATPLQLLQQQKLEHQQALQGEQIGKEKKEKRADEHSSTVRLYRIKNGDFNIILDVINVALCAHKSIQLVLHCCKRTNEEFHHFSRANTITLSAQ